MAGISWGTIVAAIIVIAVIAVVFGYLLYWFYRRASQDIAFVRTGLGGLKVVRDGGALMIPLVHAVTPVNMNTLRLEVSRERERAVITKDRMRVDVAAEFYVCVSSDEKAIAAAARTLGQRTMNPPALTELMEGKFVDALRRVGSEFTMEELHERRGEFAKRVKEAVADDLIRNGLELEAVSITQLDQTNMEYFNPSNAFDAEGLTRLTSEIENRKKTRNDIEQDTLIQIRNKNLEAEKIGLSIDRDSEYARLTQEREIEMARASQRAEVARERAARERESQQAELEERQALETARIAAERLVDEARIEREREIEQLEIERRKTIEMAEQDRTIALAEKSLEESRKRAEAEAARAEVAVAEERIMSARELEVAERRKRIALIAAQEDAEREGTRLRLVAEAERDAAGDRAEATRIAAEGEAEAERIRALASKIRHEVEAEAMRMMNEAQNVLSNESRTSALRQRLIEKMDSIIRESVKPLEKIEGIRILHVDGLTGSGGGEGRGAGGGTPSDDVINSALRYRAQAPLVDYLLREIGIESGDVKKFADNLIQPRRSELTKLAEQGREAGEDSGRKGEGGKGAGGKT